MKISGKIIFKKFKKGISALFRLMIWVSIGSIVLVFFANWRINAISGKYIYSDISLIPHNKVGLVLGTSKQLVNGRENLYFAYRINAVVELYEAGKIDYVLVSGDNGTKYYNEPFDMKKALMQKGIPEEKIFLDYAGFRTYDSMVRAEKIFGQTSYTVISQKFHVQRAVYIGKRLKHDVVGYTAKNVSKYSGFKTQVREKFARVKVFLDFIFGIKPKFLGDPVEIRDSTEE